MRAILLVLISLGFVVGGVMHFTHDTDLAAITPLPFALEIVWVTGIMEFFFAVFLFIPRFRAATGLWLSVFCLLVLTANINMAINNIPMFGEPVDPVIAWVRIPMQFVLIALILYASAGWSAWQKLGWRAFIATAK